MKKRESLDEQFLLDTIENAGRPLRLDDILRIGGFSRKLKREVIAALHDLAGEGRLVRLQGGGWAMASAMKTTRGRLAIQRSGAAFVTPEGETAKSGKDAVKLAALGLACPCYALDVRADFFASLQSSDAGFEQWWGRTFDALNAR